MTDNIEIVVGTYEQFLVGYRVKKEEGKLILSHSFATHAHTGSVKCITAAGNYLASGGSDDKIVIHDMVTRTESRILMHHNSTVNSLSFTEDGTHLFSAGSDGSLCAIKTGNWQIEKEWQKAHKGAALTYICIHPSNKLALTIGDDHSLRTWNLIKGRQAYVTNLKSKGTACPISVVWSPEGEQFSLTGYNDVSVWSVSNAGIEKLLKCPSKSICMVWITENIAAVGLESGEIVIFDLNSEQKYTFNAHSQRVKAMSYSSEYLYTASSAGDIKIWKFKQQKMKLIEKAHVNTDCRITCLTLVNHLTLIKKEDNVEHVQSDVEVIEENCANEKIDEVRENGDQPETFMEKGKVGFKNENVHKQNKKFLMPYVSIEQEDKNNKHKLNKTKKFKNKQNKFSNFKKQGKNNSCFKSKNNTKFGNKKKKKQKNKL